MPVLPYLRLFRADAAIIAFFSFLYGAELAGGAGWRELLAALLVTGVSANFCYTYNSWTDREADRINKPGRPIPAGQVPPGRALALARALLAGSLVYPFFLSETWETLALYLLIPLLGWSYSSPWVRLKNHPPFSILAISMGLTIPLVLGYIILSPSMSRTGLFLCVFIFCTSVVPLKDIGDEAGDIRAGEVNLHQRYGKHLPVFTLTGLAVVILAALALDEPLLIRGGMILLAISGLVVVGGYVSPLKVPGNPYTLAIRLVEGLSVGGWLAAFLANRDLLGPLGEAVRQGMGLG
ncbi:MAG: UbiA family prenyltransferase [Proteobacteria bacterium]|nr:UbiA family prenyltransferase [Pseudomonadota bacterium]